MNVYFCERSTIYLSKSRSNQALYQRNDVISKPIATSAIASDAKGRVVSFNNNDRMKLKVGTNFRGHLTDYRKSRTQLYYGLAPVFAGIDALLMTSAKYILPQLQEILANCNGDMNRFMEIIVEKEAYYLSNLDETFHIIMNKIINTLTYSYYYSTSILRFSIKTLLEQSAVKYLPHKYADKLTKSVINSYVRKINRFNNRFYASYRLVRTYIFANLISEVSFACIETCVDNLIYPIYNLHYPSPGDKTKGIVATNGSIITLALPTIARNLFHRGVNLVLYSILYSAGCSIHIFPTYNCGNLMVFVATIVDPSRILFGSII